MEWKCGKCPTTIPMNRADFSATQREHANTHKQKETQTVTSNYDNIVESAKAQGEAETIVRIAEALLAVNLDRLDRIAVLNLVLKNTDTYTEEAN